MGRRAALGKMGAALFPVSDVAGTITGQVSSVDGGRR
jgi:enoyl-[acyl-carrier-protein] reductase (NADH)